MSDREPPQELSSNHENEYSQRVKPPHFSELLREELHKSRIVAKGILLAVGGGSAIGALGVAAMSALDVGSQDSRFLGGLTLALVHTAWVHLRLMRHDYRRLLTRPEPANQSR